MGVSISCFFIGLAYWIRAGLANTDIPDRKRSTYQAEQILLAIGSLIWVDLPALTVTRDEVLMEKAEEIEVVKTRPFRAPHHWLPKWAWLGRVLLLVAAILYIAGFISLPRPADAQPAFGKTTGLRLAASLIVFLILLFNLMFLAYAPIKFIARIDARAGIRDARILVLGLNLFILVTAFYNFVIVAITDDNNPMINSKVFFYFAYAFFPILMVAIVVSLKIRVWTGTGEIPWWQA